MNRQYILFIALLFLSFGCSKEYELKKSVMIYDEEFVDLPAYSEWGYNTFGAYYDREVFISNNQQVPAKVIVTDNEMSFVLSGQKGAFYDYTESYSPGHTPMALTFSIDGFSLESYTDIILFHDTVFNLENPAHQLTVEIDSEEFPVNILKGELIFKRAQNLLVDKEHVQVILSGTFDFQAIINNKPVTISDGRFDVGISKHNFYIY